VPWRVPCIKGRSHLKSAFQTLVGRTIPNSKTLQIPFSCVAVDIDKGEECGMTDGKVWERPSEPAHPFRDFTPGGMAGEKPGGRITVKSYTDENPRGHGGRLCNLQLMCSPARQRITAMKRISFPFMLKSFYLLDSMLIETSMSTADAVIEPDVIGISFTDFHPRSEEWYRSRAPRAARLAIPEIKKMKLRVHLSCTSRKDF